MKETHPNTNFEQTLRITEQLSKQSEKEKAKSLLNKLKDLLEEINLIKPDYKKFHDARNNLNLQPFQEHNPLKINLSTLKNAAEKAGRPILKTAKKSNKKNSDYIKQEIDKWAAIFNLKRPNIEILFSENPSQEELNNFNIREAIEFITSLSARLSRNIESYQTLRESNKLPKKITKE